MKVLQINSVCGFGSTGRIATDIDKLLKDQGHESYIAYGRGNAKNCETAIRIGKDIDNYLHVATTRVFDKHGFGSVKATKNFIKQIEELNPDVIQLHNIHGYYLNIEILFDYLKTTNKPVVWTLHDCWAFTGHCAYFDFVNCDKWQTGCQQCPQKKSYPTSFLDNSKNNYSKKREIFNGIKNLTIVTPSKWLAGLVQNSFLREYPVKVINNGIDFNVFKPTKSKFREKYKLNNKFIILGIASVWEKRKGIEYFFELSNKLKSDEVIVLVGLSEKIKKNLPTNIIGITRTNNARELVEIYSAADVFINPTLEDNYPTTNLESMACGTPVITFDTGGSIESINDNCGYVVEKGNVEKLISTIEIVKQKSKLNYVKNCVQNAVDSFRKEDKFNEYLQLYKKVIN